MLVLSRKPNEEIVIAGGVRIMVLSADRHKVKLGIVAPPEVAIWRAELKTAPMSQEERSQKEVSGELGPYSAPPAIAAIDSG